LQKHLREEMNILLDGIELERLMLQAGFVDVSSRTIKIEVGDWGPGVRLPVDVFSLLDPNKHELARHLLNVWCLAMQALAETNQSTANEEELSEFVEGVKNDIENKDYQLYCNLYIPTPTWDYV
jgi:hypothetical protein